MDSSGQDNCPPRRLVKKLTSTMMSKREEKGESFVLNRSREVSRWRS
jgi:hypothetical protein